MILVPLPTKQELSDIINTFNFIEDAPEDLAELIINFLKTARY